MKAAIVTLNSIWPAGIQFPELATRARALLEEKAPADGESRTNHDPESDQRGLTAAFLTAFTKGLCELRTHPGAFTISSSERPCACPLIRLQATRGNVVTNRRHGRLTLDDFSRHLVPLLDGTRDLNALKEALVALVASGHLTVNSNNKPVVEPDLIQAAIAKQLELKLKVLARHAALIA